MTDPLFLFVVKLATVRGQLTVALAGRHYPDRELVLEATTTLDDAISAFLQLHQGGLQEALWQELGASIANRETEVQ